MRAGRLTVLGCGDAFASGGRHCTSFLIERDEGSVLLDCGASTLIRLKQLQIDMSKITTVVITHFHGDHYGGLPFIFLSLRFEMQREEPLTIVGPPGLREKVYLLQEVLYPETSFVLDELNLNFVEYTDQWLDLATISVQAFRVSHSPPSCPHGIRLRWNDQVLGFSGDTEWDDHLISLAEDTALMICECNLCDEPAPGHLDYETLLAKAPLMKTRRLLLSHLGPKMLAKETAFEKLEDGMQLPLW